nr:hypothetical protein [Tanacetum cinerariifolium]
MIAILEKYEHNQDFHQIVDFVEAFHIRYALTFNPTIYVSHIRQFWSTARIESSEEGTKLLATVDGKLRTISESSIRRNLKLNDEARINSLQDAKLFENLTLMGYNISPNQKFTFQKEQFSHQWKYLIHTIMQCLSSKSTGFNEFSSNIATALVCLATNRVYNFSKTIFDGMVKNVNNKVSKFLMYPRFLSKCLKMGQFGKITHTHTYVVPFHTRKFFTTLWVNSPSFLGRTVPLFLSMLVTMGEGSGTPTEPHYTPTPKATPSPQHELSSSLLLPAITKPLPNVIPFDNPPLKQYTRRARIAQSSALPPVADEPASPIGDDSQGEACPTDSSLEADQDRANITKTSTLPSDSTPRATSLAADEGNMQHQIQELKALCTSLQRQHTEMASKIEAQELEITNLKARVKLLEDSKGGGIAQPGNDAPIKGRSLDEWEEAAKKGSDDTIEMVTVLTSLDPATVLSSGVAEVPTGSGSIPTAGHPATGVPTGSEVVLTASSIFTTAIESTPYTRRKGKEKMVESDTPKKKKLQEQIDVQVARELEEEMERDAQRMNEQITRDAEIVRIHAEEELQMMIDGLDRNNETVAKLTKENLSQGNNIDIFICQCSRARQEDAERFKRKGLRLEHDSTKKVKTTEEVPEEKLKEIMELIPVKEVYVEALQHLVRKDLNQLWALVKETLNIRPATNDKEMELWVELKRLYKPDVEDQLWTHTQNLMDTPVEWKLYNTCGVHHVISKDQEMFMLVEKDYPLKKDLAIVMICYKLQVENYSKWPTT